MFVQLLWNVCPTSVISVRLLNHVRLFATPWTTGHQASLSITNSPNLVKLMSIESVMPSNHLIFVVPFSCFQSSSAPGSFLMSQFFATGGQSIGVSASASVLPMNIQAWFPSGLTGLISLQSKGLSRVFSNTTVQKHQFFGTQLSLWSNSHIHTWLLLLGAQYATGEEWRHSSIKNEEMEPKQKQCSVVDVTSDGSKVWCS